VDPREILKVREVFSGGERQFVATRGDREYVISRHPKYGYFRVDPYPHEGELAEIYRDFDNPTYSFHEFKYLDLIENRLKLTAGNRWKVTEIGCGNGSTLAHFRERGHTTFGFEPGRKDAALCRTRGLDVEECNFDPEVLAQRGLQDLIIMTNLLEHVPNPDAFLRNVSRHLNPATGFLVIQVPNEFNPFQEQFIRNAEIGYFFIGPPIHLTYFQPDSLERLLEDCGYRVVHRTCDFPMEFFLLSGCNYIGNLALGSQCHQERVAFELSLRTNMNLLWDFYDALASKNLGREIVIVARIGSEGVKLLPDCQIETVRLEIRRLRVQDVTDAYVAALNDPLVNRYIEVRRQVQTFETVREFVAVHFSRNDAILFGVFAKSDGRLIGTVRLYEISAYHFSAIIGVCIFSRDSWGQGLGAEAVAAIVEWAFQDLGLHYVEAACFEENPAAVAMFRRAGFDIKAVFREKYRFDERFAPVVMLGAVNPRFDATRLTARP
jgi:RimJ/RimL family protein N-acetyltransferase/SAM-dependent methyltransferase